MSSNRLLNFWPQREDPPYIFVSPHSWRIYRYKDGRKLNGIIFLHRISDARMGGIAQKNFRRFRKLCGDHTLKNVVIVTTMWDTTAPEVAEKRERELAQNAAFFKPALDKGAQMRRHDNSLHTSTEVLRTILGFPPEVLRIQYETVDEGKTLVQTDAGRDLIGELQVQATKHRAEIDDLKRAMREAAESRHADQMQKIQELNERLLEARTELEKVEDENRELREGGEDDKRRSEEKMRNLMEAMNKREADVRRLLKDNEALQARLAEEGSRRARAEESLKRAVQGRRDGPGSIRKGRSIFSVVMEAALSFLSKRR